MSLRTRSFQVAAMAAALVPSVTLADSVGAQGTVDSLTVYESTSTEYQFNNGILTIKEESGTKTQYKWGGSYCPNRTISANSVSLLFDALRSQTDVMVVPSYQMGNSTKCLTGFKLKVIERTVQ